VQRWVHLDASVSIDFQMVIITHNDAITILIVQQIVIVCEL